MNKICTTIEQSKKLLYLGIKAETADMWYINGEGKPRIGKWSENQHDWDDIPAWSLVALIEILRQRKDCNSLNTHTNSASLCFVETSYYKNANWQKISCVKENLIDACVEIIIKLHEQNLL